MIHASHHINKTAIIKDATLNGISKSSCLVFIYLTLLQLLTAHLKTS